MKSGREDRSAEGVYTNLVNKLLVSQKQYLSYRTIRVHNNESKWMTARVKHYIGLKRNIYEKLEVSDEPIQCFSQDSEKGSQSGKEIL